MRSLVLIFSLFVSAAMASGDMTPISVHNPQIAASVGTAKTGAGYMIVMNMGEADDRLLSAEAEYPRVEVHNVISKDGVMSMVRQDDGVVIPADGEVVFAPGGYHVMFMGLTEPFLAGEKVDVVLVFEHAGRMTVSFDVVPRDMIGGKMEHSGHGTD